MKEFYFETSLGKFVLADHKSMARGELFKNKWKSIYFIENDFKRANEVLNKFYLEHFTFEKFLGKQGVKLENYKEPVLIKYE